MSKKWLLLDCNYLCHRAKYTTEQLSYEGSATGVIYELLRSLETFQDLFRTSRFVFCWDSKISKRRELYPEYKTNRQHKKLTKKETAFDIKLKSQMEKLRVIYLPAIGFKNIFIQEGYESDDIIASICDHIRLSRDEAIIISSDHDLYQCISHNISFFAPKAHKILTLQRFQKQYGISPTKWGLVKSIAGCATDNIPGVKGVGEKTAIKFLTNKLNPDSRAYQNITSPTGIIAREKTILLVVLPLFGIKKFELRQDKLSEQGWKQVTKKLGMKSIRNKMPFGKRK